MHVLHVNATSHTGGAARAMRRLHQALADKGHQSQFLVGRSIHPEDPLVHLIWKEVAGFTTLPNRIKSRIGNQLERYIGIHPWSNQNNLRITDTDLYRWADIIDLRNLFGGFFNLWCLPELSAHKPVVWRMPDLWAITGHCAYPYDCQRWQTGCYSCPLLTREGRQKVEPKPTLLDGTRRVWQAKKDIYQRSRLHIIVTTSWMKEQVSQSILKDAFSINVISNGVDLGIYKPYDRMEARRKLELDPNDKILLWTAGGKGNYRKGYHLTCQALEQIQKETQDPPLLITMGGDEGWSQPEALRKIRHFGYVRDSEQQALIYSAADVFLCTTLADAQPQTTLEAMACGTPVIAFEIGPMPESVIPGKTGYLAGTPTVPNLKRAIENFLEDADHQPFLREACREKALREYDISLQTQKYVNLYEKLLNRDPYPLN